MGGVVADGEGEAVAIRIAVLLPTHRPRPVHKADERRIQREDEARERITNLRRQRKRTPSQFPGRLKKSSSDKKRPENKRRLRKLNESVRKRPRKLRRPH